MRVLRSVVALVVAFALSGCGSTPQPKPDPKAAASATFDLVVYGGTSGGIVAAVQARRMGRTVLVIEPTRHIGGMSTSGLGATDIGNKRAIGGIAREFYRAIKDHYAEDTAWIWQAREEFKGRGHKSEDDAAWTFEPRVAEKIFHRMCEEHGVEVWYGERLDRGPGGVAKNDDSEIEAIRLESGRVVSGRMFLDASYEGDLMAAAGVTYRVGREAQAEFDESLNGIRVEHAVKHQFDKAVDAYVIPGDRRSGLLWGVRDDGPGEEGAADHRVQAYCYRICATDVDDNRLPWPVPKNYDSKRYEILFRNFAAGDLRKPWHPVRMPNGKTDSNNNFAFSTDMIGANWEYPDADYETRERIVAEHLEYTAGLMWTLANHPRVPEEVRAHYSSFGLARDEFQDNDHWPYQLYVREARRMVGFTVMHEGHCRGTVIAPDSVGLGAYGMDSHNVQRYVDAAGKCRNEGDVQVHGFDPYPIAYSSILPTRIECANLLVPVCLSATHIAFGSIRMEPVFMVLGQSAATAACLALDMEESLHDLSYVELRNRLLSDGQVLSWQPVD